MRSSLILLAGIGLALGGCGWTKQAPKPEPVAAAHPVVGTQLAANNTGGDPDQIVCKREEVTGSRLEGHRECHTRSEWVQLRQQGLDHLQMLSAPGPTSTQTAAQAGNGP